ncbi:MAG: MlaE family lipid ABC transporter permease subunit [Oscillatoriales cyanobacterium]|uniref:MlaE family lipid ABC transporter permease subunit n=1 Tax=Microcoleus anatoxicus PTRS2 TaxID=2705321 RepID=A0ABU8YKQ3_9CYAN|nr:MAG: MlaE family lipid ABC transporter permease subunit [Oscillatoriales cyanobacterium]TAD97328.1 MAG: MlaE family lipid ABC transporter permease subunit [Oscillatoriales cyanobacterium]TAE07150.1 MAG: MlaE family lipid ABC transporter permease subunit [Oscillatoriales cyanobacterium]TAF05751.1 MAG: MlaE family lipid ABC transporter permease subunit [Oscillatoriales cyanobacterium]TAF42545.1 MAG: MlaE family lipid ABC transporter permease subunit [Oscillatoriales cyanobacterium]
MVKKYQDKRDRPLDETFNNRWFQRFSVTMFLGGQVLWRILSGKIDRRKIMEHLVTVGLDSLRAVLLIAFFAGMIFTIQSARELMRFGAVGAVGGAFALAFCRELAPVLTAGVVAGQVGSAFAAEIGEMQVTEQIDALYMLRTNPVDYLVVPRVIACCVMLPVLTIFSVAVGIIGGVFVAAIFYELEPSVFLESVRTFLGPWDLVTVAIKSFIFGLIIAIVGCGWGLTTTGGGKGVGQAATAAVVTSWVFIFVADFFLSLLLFHELGITRS